MRRRQAQKFDPVLIDRAIEIHGSAVALAGACGVVTSAITNARQRGEISPELALKVHWATCGEVSAHELRPDLWRHRAHVPKPNGGKHARR